MDYLLLVFTFVAVFLNVTSGRSNGSNEHAIREMLLTDYDKTVRPPPSSLDESPITVEFGLMINKLVELDSIEELITVNTWVVMAWNNSFFSWKPQEFGGMERVQFLPSEIWFPDIVLYNNGDGSTPRAGGRSKFLSNVVIESNGRNTWSGPASFTASCKLTLNAWPFDDQTCELQFGSYSYGSNLLKVVEFRTKGPKSGNYLRNANWNVESQVTTQIGEANFGNCCPFTFSQIAFTLKMERRIEYFLFYLMGPCLVLSMLTLVSFWIPSESGERIGFVTTLLLGMMVFLLVVPQSLPQSSETIPVLGIVMMGTMVMITAVLFATIFVLRMFHSPGVPPKYLRRIFTRSSRLQPEPIQVLEAPDRKDEGTVSDVQLQDKHNDATSVKLAEGEMEVTWQLIANKMDKVFFYISFVVIIVIYCVLLTYH